MTVSPSTLGRGAPAAHTARARRLSSSVWLPWFAGLIGLLLIAIGSIALVGRDRGQEGVTEPVIVAQDRVADAAAQFFRRSANEAVADLVTAAAQFAAAPRADIADTLLQMLQSQDRWTSLAAIAADGTVLASVGDGVASRVVVVNPSADPGITIAESEGKPLVVSTAPLARVGDPPAVLVGVSDELILDVSLAVARPGAAYAVDDEGRVLASYGRPDDVAALPDDELRAAAERGSAGSVGTNVPSVSGDQARVVSWAPVEGQGPAGSLQWAVVVDRSVADLVDPNSRYRTPGIVFGLVLALVALAVFAWIWRRVLHPLEDLENEAERVAYGDLRRVVPVVRFDEVGRIARALERLRLQLIGRRVKDSARRPDPASPTAEESGD